MRFLIVRLSSLGDVIHSLPLVYLLKKNFPDSKVDWLTASGCKELLSLISEIDNVYLPSDLSLVQSFKYDYVIDVQGLFKSALLSKLCFGKKTVGFKGAREFAHLFYDKKIDAGDLFNTTRHIVDINKELILWLLKSQITETRFLIPKINQPHNKGLFRNLEHEKAVVVFPGTRWESKMWEINYWFDLISDLSCDFQIYLCASANDLKYIGALTQRLNAAKIRYVDLTGKTTIVDLIFLLQNTKLVIGLDSFGLHLASAIKNDYNLPEVIGIYGPTSPLRSGPYNQTNNCLYLSELDCTPCKKKKCPLGHHNCMNSLIPVYVKEMAYSVLNS